MMKFFLLDNRLGIANEQTTENTVSEEEVLSRFAESLRELRTYCGVSLVTLGKSVEIPNQTLSTYENKVHTPSMLQAIKLAAYFGLTVEEFILCGFDEYPYDIIELYERRKNGL